MIQRLDRISLEPAATGAPPAAPCTLEGDSGARVAELLVREAAASGFAVEMAERHITVESRYDTEAGMFERAGLTFAVRSIDGLATAAIERGAPNVLIPAATVFQGYVTPLHSPSELRDRGDALGKRLRILVGARSFKLRWTLHSLKTVYRLRDRLGPETRVEFDEYTVTVAEEERPRTVVRLTLPEGVAPGSRLGAVLDQVQAACGLRTAERAPESDGLATLLGLPSPAPEFGAADLGSDPPVAALAYAVLGRHFQEMLRREPGTRLGDDVEELHRMRVAIRKLRATIKLFGACLPARVTELRRGFRWIARALAPVRDLDVQILQLRAWEAELPYRDRLGLRPVIELMLRRRERARLRMLPLLDSERFDNIIAHASAALRAGPPANLRPAQFRAAAIVPALIDKLQRKVLRDGGRLAPSAPPERCHALRLRAKALRYALDGSDYLFGEPARRYARQLARLQEALGQHRDAIIAVARLRALAASKRPKLSNATAFTVGVFTERYTQKASALLRRIPREVRKLEGKRWRRLAKTMRALAAPAPPPALAPPLVPTDPAAAAAPAAQDQPPIVPAVAAVSPAQSESPQRV
ncbi:MAG: CHAD domain-containing protein [Planctomycetes bacterium]|nr:CHAD domain-containing protein [Planctomycetota bacterium]